MPIENEQIYILSPGLSEKPLRDWEKVAIRQAWMDDGPRVRQYNNDYIFTYKRWLLKENAFIEIETELSKKDFQRLWEQSDISLQKTRYIKQQGDIEWVVDFLKDEQGKIYCVRAEAEMPEGMEKPDKIIKEVKPHIIFTPKKGDIKYSNKQLADQKYAKQLLKELQKCP